jgi:hypothetical protein
MLSKDRIIEEIKRVAGKLGSKSLKQKDFELNSTIPINTVKYYLGPWEQALEQANLAAGQGETKKEPKERELKEKEQDKLLLELLRIFNASGEEPTSLLVDTKGRYGEHEYRKHWKSLHEAFLLARKKFPEKFEHFKKEDSSISIEDAERALETYPLADQHGGGEEENMGESKVKYIPRTIKPKQGKKRSRKVGEPINFRSIKHAPVEKMGVVFLFSMVAAELGFAVESISPDFPDCEGKRCVDLENERWEHVRIQIEYKSSDLQKQEWNENECDILICWIHDWDDCPIEILELKSEISRFEQFDLD